MSENDESEVVDWQDEMISYFGTNWIKESYNIKEIGDFAEKIAALKNENEKLKKKLSSMDEVV